MLQIGAFEAKNTFGALLDRAEAGEDVLITRHGRPVARLISEPIHDVAKAKAAADRIRQRAVDRKGGSFNWEEWKAYRDEGRR
jgi:prevent-host-death family protein